MAFVGLGGCGGDDTEVAIAGSDGQLLASESEWSVILNAAQLPPGDVTITAKNEGTVEHELIVARSDEAKGALPIVDGRVPEDKIDIVGEISEFPAGKTSSKQFELTAGRYLLFCNLPTHYQLGMVAELTVG